MNLQIPENLYQRKIHRVIKSFLESEKILLLTGVRQSGKTSLLYLLIQDLIKKGVTSNQIIFFDLENVLTFQKLNDLKDFDDFLAILKTMSPDFSQKIYVFIDEVQYLDNAASFLKYLHDHYKQKIKFIVSGSSSLEIKKKLTAKLTGRVYRFTILPLDFEEYLKFTKQPLNQESFEQFSLFGAYPAVALLTQNLVKEKELAEIYSLYVKRDIQNYAGIEDANGFNNLVRILASQTANLINEVELANTLGLSRQTIKKYLFLLENTYVINLLKPFFSNKRKELIKMPKIFFIDTGLRNATLENLSQFSKRTDIGQLIENSIFLEIIKKINHEEKGQVYFWRTQTKQEVDFILNLKDQLLPIEVKYQSFQKPLIPRNLKDFLKVYKTTRAIVVTKDFETILKFAQTTVSFIPAYKFPQSIF